MTTQYLPYMLHTYFLNGVVLTVAEFVKIPVNLWQAYIIVKMIFEILHCGGFALTKLRVTILQDCMEHH